jgi:hypothetical protein
MKKIDFVKLLGFLCLVLITILVMRVPALAQNDDPNLPTPLILNDEQGEYKLGRYLQILEDPAGNLTIQEVSSPSYSEKFTASAEETPTFGYSSSTYWVRFHLKNEQLLAFGIGFFKYAVCGSVHSIA